MMNSDGLLFSQPSILVVDDTLESLSLLSLILKDVYRVKIANNGEKALQIAQGAEPPDLILLDIMMPDLDGYEVCRRLKRNPVTRQIPVIFLTAKTDIADEEKGLELGAVDYIMKPVSPPIVLARVKAQLQLKAVADFLRDKNAYLEQIIDRRTLEVRTLQEVMMFGLASLAETRDNETGNHIRRTQYYIRRLAEKLRPHPRFEAFLTEYNISMLFRSAPLHDIGKVGIPDVILLKPGPLTVDEYRIMKTHTLLGKEALEKTEHRLGIEVGFLKIAKEIVYSHHERWDGEGYPQRLSGEEIPIAARLMAIADVYDAIISRRIYKESVPHARAVEIIRVEKGQHFDPDITEAFLSVQDDFKEIADRFADGT